jgi:hypothetical protein
MEMTATTDWRWIAERPEIVSEMERPKTVEPSKYRLYTKIANTVALGVVTHWDDLDERVRHALRLLVVGTFEPHKIASKWVRLASNVQVFAAFVRDREAVSEYTTALRRARQAVMTAVERENERYQGALSSALAEATEGTRRSEMTAREASAFIRTL